MNELEVLEDWFKEHGGGLPSLTAAKGFTAMAHDWFDMDCDEKGEHLLETAELLYPGYFEGPIKEHVKKDLDFSKLVSHMTTMPFAFKALKYYGFK